MTGSSRKFLHTVQALEEVGLEGGSLRSEAHGWDGIMG
jgi:hypothetical protein